MELKAKGDEGEEMQKSKEKAPAKSSVRAGEEVKKG
jgi:hypothetical protein